MGVNSVEAKVSLTEWTGDPWPLLSSNSLRGRAKTPYLSIATPLQHLVGRVSGMGLVGNEVGVLHLIDGLDLGESGQVFVIKDLIIHFSLGQREMDRKEAER